MAWNWFDRELADINATLARLASDSNGSPAASAPPAQRPRATAPAPVEVPRKAKGSGASGGAHVRAEVATERPPPAASKPAPTPTPAPPAPAPAVAAPLPTGSDLSDPKNFGVMPPTGNLEQGSASSEDYRKRLARDLAFANKVLHTSRVPAAVWREWRVFEKAAHERLRALTVQPPPME